MIVMYDICDFTHKGNSNEYQKVSFRVGFWAVSWFSCRCATHFPICMLCLRYLFAELWVPQEVINLLFIEVAIHSRICVFNNQWFFAYFQANGRVT